MVNYIYINIYHNIFKGDNNMKTNQIMKLDFDGKTLEIEHKTKFGSLTELWNIGNARRAEKGLNELDLASYLRSPETLELVQAIERKYGIYKPLENNEDFKSDDSTHLKKSNKGRVDTIKSELIRTKRGRHGGGTWAHLYLLLDAALRLDADFKVKLFDILIEGKLLDWRDDSGDSYKALNVALHTTVLKKTGIEPSIGTYITVANAIREKVKPTGGEWNTATFNELKMRTDIENNLITILKLDLVNNLEHLLSMIKEM